MELLFILVGFVVFVVPLWALARTFRLKRDSVTIEDLAAFEKRLGWMETKVENLRKGLENAIAAGATLQTPTAETKLAPAEKPAATPERPAPAPPRSETTPPAIPAEHKTEIPPPPVVPPQRPIPPPATEVPAAKPVPPTAAGAAAPPSPPKPATPAPPIAARPQVAQPAAPKKQWADIEERVGMSWLVKIGITALVIGLVFLLNEVVPRMGKGGKVALAYSLSVALLALGVRGEKSEKYRNIARVVLGGGWAATYGTTYALHNVSAVQVVESPVLGFLLLFAVAAGIVAHSLRYDSQVVTGFAYVLGFVTMVLGQMNLWTMVASALLAASLVVVLKMRRWYWLEPVGIAATYIVHWAWLRQVFEGLVDRKHFADFIASAVLLTVYWIIFTASHFLRDDREREQKLWLSGAFLLNAAGYLAVMRYQSLYPDLRIWFLLGVGTTYLILCAGARGINRRLAFLLASTLGVALVVVAIPYHFSGAPLEFIWLLEAEALLFIGWRLAEPHLRNLGWGAAAVLVPYVVYHDIAARLNKWQEPDKQLGVLLFFIGLAYLANERFVQRFLKNDATQIDLGAAMIAGPVATAMLLTAAFAAFPFMWVAVVWAALAFALWEYGHRLDDQTLRYCGSAAALAAVFRVVLVNVQKAPAPGATNLRVWTTVLAVAICYALARRMRSAEPAEAPGHLIQEFFGRGPAAIFAWVATVPAVFLVVAEAAKHKPELFLSVPDVTWGVLALALTAIFLSYPIAVGLLMTATWLALPYMWTALMWTGLAVAASEIGLRCKDRVLRVCGHIAALLAIGRLLLVNMQYAPQFPGANQRVVTVALAVAVFYLFARRMSPAKSEPELETPITDEIVWRGGMPAVYTWLGALLAGLLIWNEWHNVTPAAVALAWAMLGLALVEVGKPLADRAMRAQGYTLMAFSFLWIFIGVLNIPKGEGISPRLVTITLLAAIYYYSAFTADKGTDAAAGGAAVVRHFGAGSADALRSGGARALGVDSVGGGDGGSLLPGPVAAAERICVPGVTC